MHRVFIRSYEKGLFIYMVSLCISLKTITIEQDIISVSLGIPIQKITSGEFDTGNFDAGNLTLEFIKLGLTYKND